jgi:3D (Asp-Asp-Asp) domain-containing protein
MRNISKAVIGTVAVITLVLGALSATAAAAPKNFKAAYDIVATAYAPGPHDNGKWGDLTHIGTRVRPGIIAVDPRLIPLGSRVYIEFADGSGAYATAEDTGGAIKGRRIDVAMATVDDAYDFGMQKVKVYVLE